MVYQFHWKTHLKYCVSPLPWIEYILPAVCLPGASWQWNSSASWQWNYDNSMWKLRRNCSRQHSPSYFHMRPQQLKSNAVLFLLLSLTYGIFHETQKLHGWTDLWSDQIKLFIISSAMRNIHGWMKVECDPLLLEGCLSFKSTHLFASVIKRLKGCALSVILAIIF